MTTNFLDQQYHYSVWTLVTRISSNVAGDFHAFFMGHRGNIVRYTTNLEICWNANKHQSRTKTPNQKIINTPSFIQLASKTRVCTHSESGLEEIRTHSGNEPKGNQDHIGFKPQRCTVRQKAIGVPSNPFLFFNFFK